MRLLALAPPLALLSACVVVDTPPPPPPVVQPAPPQPPPARAVAVDERTAVARAFDYARDRGLQVDRVNHVHLDEQGRWHVDLRGPGGDIAKMLLDGEDGRLLKGRFREKGAGGDGADERDDWE
jgi:hypothetical protein